MINLPFSFLKWIQILDSYSYSTNNLSSVFYLQILCFILQKRHVLEENNELDSRVSLLEIDDFDLDDEDEEEEDEDDEDFEEKKRIAEMLDKAKQSSKDERRDRYNFILDPSQVLFRTWAGPGWAGWVLIGS